MTHSRINVAKITILGNETARTNGPTHMAEDEADTTKTFALPSRGTVGSI
jgi:hypothetical protein